MRSNSMKGIRVIGNNIREKSGTAPAHSKQKLEASGEKFEINPHVVNKKKVKKKKPKLNSDEITGLLVENNVWRGARL